jgi:hypothetical protein
MNDEKSRAIFLFQAVAENARGKMFQINSVNESSRLHTGGSGNRSAINAVRQSFHQNRRSGKGDTTRT